MLRTTRWCCCGRSIIIASVAVSPNSIDAAIHQKFDISISSCTKSSDVRKVHADPAVLPPAIIGNCAAKRSYSTTTSLLTRWSLSQPLVNNSNNNNNVHPPRYCRYHHHHHQSSNHKSVLRSSYYLHRRGLQYYYYNNNNNYNSAARCPTSSLTTCRRATSTTSTTNFFSSKYGHFQKEEEEEEAEAAEQGDRAAGAGFARIVVNACDVAAAIDMNKYRPQLQVLVDMWQRIDPAGYEEALIRNQLLDQVVSEHEHVEQIMTHEPMKELMERAIEASTPEELSAKLDEIELQLAEAIPSELPEISEATIEHARRIIESEVRTTRGIENEEMAIEEYEEQMAIIAGYEAPPPEVAMRNDRVYTLRLSFPSMIFDSRARRHANKNKNENRTISFKVCGKVDGVITDAKGRPERVVEVKNRQRKLFYSIPKHEMVQVQVYMQLIDVDACDFTERLNKRGSKPEVYVQTVHRDQRMWEREIVPRLYKFVWKLDKLLDNHALQDEILAYIENHNKTLVNNTDPAAESCADSNHRHHHDQFNLHMPHQSEHHDYDQHDHNSSSSSSSNPRR